jgi:hypothetical protein
MQQTGPGQNVLGEAHRLEHLTRYPKLGWVLSGENATDVVEKTPSACPCMGSPINAPDMASQIQTVMSHKPETMRVPS